MQSIKDTLWSYGISGDNPIVSIIIKDYEDINVIYDVIKAHEYWKTKGIIVDLVIINKEGIKYEHPIWEGINDVIDSSHLRNVINKNGGVFLIRGEVLDNEEYTNFIVASNIAFEDGEYNIKPIDAVELVKKDFESYEFESTSLPKKAELQYFNGIGGFDEKNNEYILYPSKDNLPPVPWVNVIANKNVGAVLTETGGGFSWLDNSREFRITPWSNDVISDKRGEIIYIQDEKTGKLFNPYILPCTTDGFYEVKYGLGYCEYVSEIEGINSNLKVFIPVKDNLKVSILKIKNNSDKRRELNIAYFIDPTLSYSANGKEKYIEASYENNLITFSNKYEKTFSDKRISMSFNVEPYSYCLNRDRFFGLGNETYPDIFNYENFGNIKEGVAPIGAMQLRETFDIGESKTFICLLGEDKYFDKYFNIEECTKELENTIKFFSNDIMKIKVNTPDKSMNLLLNGFLLYQSLVCRLWGRSAFYQSGGAFGYRDQLQDSLAFLCTNPDITKEQIRIHASRQFFEGDVLHWWHEEAKRGTRTRFSDDLLWLPYCVLEYLKVTGDKSILDEEIGFVQADLLNECEDERYLEFFETQEKASIYEHCIKAIDRAYKLGEHGLVLMGSGDWNDGMNLVGNKGRGESVWLSWFLYKILTEFMKICKEKDDTKRAEGYLEYAISLAKSINENAWDGEWYKRAFFDDGTPLGSIENEECKIDSISQSWSIISGAGDLEKVKRAILSAENYLIDTENRIVKLLTPPFKNSNLEPGYIKRYPVGIRENGGQYTHAAVWLGIAETILKNKDKAYEIFDILNPINRTRTDLEVNSYKVEPYVMAADVYTNPKYLGRGGWTWYTGAASWMYRFGIEYLLGLKKIENKIVMEPLMKDGWEEFEIEYKYKNTVYKIKVANNIKIGTSRMIEDGVLKESNSFELVDDGGIHFIELMKNE
ncbi:MAG: hypothetical protein E7314_05245 [Clostridiales bacterium]|nr:hypothetical protein [Clostridiales bacterium]